MEAPCLRRDLPETLRLRHDLPDATDHDGEAPWADLAAALARARSARRPGPDTPTGAQVPAWPGRPSRIPGAEPGRLDLAALLRLSLAASDATGRLRPVPSAGALHPVDAELAVGPDCSLPPGRYGYDPLRHRVHRLGPQPDGTPPGVTVTLSVTARRTTSHYGHRAWPLLLLDTGHAAGALFLAALAMGAGEPEPRLDGPAAGPLAAVHVPPPTPAPEPTTHPFGGPPNPAPDPTTHPLGIPPTPTPDPTTHPLGVSPTPRELLARRSTPPPLPGITPTPAALRAVLGTAARAGGADLRWCAAVGPPRPALLEPSPDGTSLRRYAVGEARPTLAAWAAGQAWIADAGAVLLAHGCPADADAAHIARTHLRAGFAVHLAHVTALRHGLAARPVGSWQQADLGAALGAPPGRDWIVHGLALGALRTHSETAPAALPAAEEKNPA
ncbi:SagB/ThcOx family dehydrogenase [Streptomyces sp. NPDC014861]|uniref:SagB/ThcOx family dehydrogenase n=1 Tax=Streptomyces sp. NPDC014861 TaxID=3364923 RepID=UPI0036FC8220